MPIKELFVVAGPNGAGKSTFAVEFLSQHPCPYLSADAIAAELVPKDPTSARFEAGREFLLRIGEQLALAEDCLVETTLSGRTIRHVLEAARAAGFTITIIFVYLDSADTCVARVQERVRKGGHDVPEPDIRRRYARSFHNFWNTYRQIADLWYVVYNSTSEYIDVAFGKKDEVSVLNETQFHSFLNLTKGLEHGSCDI